MTTQETTLTAGDAEVTVAPGNGCRISSLKISGTELLRQGEKYGCFPMVPWCGRIRDGQFRDGGKVHQMPLNSPPHAIHGFARNAEWTTARETRTEAAFTYDLTDPWPYSGRVTQLVSLTENSLTLSLGVETYGDSFPAQAGWHPWFNRTITDGGSSVQIAFDPAWQEERGADHLPTGNRIEATPGPWDDCFGMPDGVDVTLSWPGALQVEVKSPEQWVVVYDEQDAAVCVEPQTGPPNGLNTAPRLVTPVEPLEASTTWTWTRL